MIRVSAPGKLMVAGEYAVLHGHGALVAAVDRRVVLTLADLGGASGLGDLGDQEQPRPLPAEAAAARAIAEARLGPAPGEMRLDVSQLRSDGQTQKLGLGSSAAAAAAAAAAVFAAHGRDLTDLAVQREVLDDAMAGHRRVAPDGSGADVAAATLGGIVRFVRTGVAFAATPASLPSGIEVRVVWTGAEARTSDLVAQVNRWAEADPRGHDDVIAKIGEAAAALAGAAGASALLAAAAAHGEAMAELGERAGAPIVEERLRSVMALAATTGGSAKPSGAGGGDVAIAFFAAHDDAERFEAVVTDADFTVLPLRLGEGGVALLPNGG